jgi:iron complex transport system permease protein
MTTTSSPTVTPARVSRPQATVFIAALGVLTLVAAVIAIGIGAVRIEPAQVIAILLRQVGIALPVAFEDQQQAVLLSIRLPRVLLGLMVGSSLAVAGAAMQGLFRNPLADPGLVGVSSGAAFAAVLVIVLGVTVFDASNLYALPVAAFLGGLATTLLIGRIASSDGRVSISTMLLAGIAIAALTGAGTGLLTFAANDAQLRSITFWGLGSLGGATWELVLSAAPFLILATLMLPRVARALNAMLLGEAEAGHLGVNVERVKRTVIICTALAVGSSVAVAGVIGFVGLVVPHLVRLAIGPDHRGLIPASALLGSSLLVAADVIARTVVAPAELPIGIVTSLLGAPFFLWLLMKKRGRA